MAKNKTQKPKSKPKPFFEDFAGLQTENGFTIEYVPKTNRLQVKKNDEFLFSDVNLTTCQNICKSRYNIKFENWKKIK